MHTRKNYYFLLAKFTAEDLELLRLFEIESAANYLQRIEEEKRTGTEERVRRTSERWIEFLVVKVLSGDQFCLRLHNTSEFGSLIFLIPRVATSIWHRSPVSWSKEVPNENLRIGLEMPQTTCPGCGNIFGVKETVWLSGWGAGL